MLHSNFVLSDPSNKYYRKAIKKEISLDMESIENDTIPTYPPSMELHPEYLNWQNKHIAGVDSSSEYGWYDLFISNKSPISNALSLGTQHGRHERYLHEIGFVKNWHSIVLKSNDKEKASENIGMEGDLNFITLPENKFDLIFCHGVLHHIINLEHLLFEINKALTKNGIFVCCEYIGENKWQWEAKKANKVNEILKKRFDSIFPVDYCKKPDLDFMNYERPLESIRSEEIPALLHSNFNIEHEFTFNYVYYPTINSYNFNGVRDSFHNETEVIEFVNYLITEEEILNNESIKNNEIIANSLAGVYRKKENPILANPKIWNERKIKYELWSKRNLIVFRGIRKFIRLKNRIISFY